MNDFDGIFIQTLGGKLGTSIGIESEHDTGMIINLRRKLFLFEGRLYDFTKASPPHLDVATTEKSIGDVRVIGT